MKKTLSVIIPFYNAEKTLKNAIESVLKQNMNEHIEIILVDDGSKDNSVNIAIEYEVLYKNVKLIKTKNQGVSHARNMGLNFSTSEYIMFLDADDTFDLNLFGWLKKVLKDDCDILIFDHIIEYSGKIYKQAIDTNNFTILDSLYCQNVAIGIEKSKTRFNTVWGKVFSKKLLDENNIRFIEGLKIGEDCLFAYTSYQYANNIKYYSFAGYYYYQNVNSTVHKFRPEMIEVDCKWQLEFKKLLDKLPKNKNYNIYINYSLAKGIINCCYLDIGHKDSKYKFRNQITMLKQLITSKPYSECNYEVIKKYFEGYNLLFIKLIKQRMCKIMIILFYIKNNKDKLKLLKN